MTAPRACAEDSACDGYIGAALPVRVESSAVLHMYSVVAGRVDTRVLASVATSTGASCLMAHVAFTWRR